MEKNKVLIIIQSLDFGGAERQTIDLINGFDPDKFEMFLLYLDNKTALLPMLHQESMTYCGCLYRRGKFDIKLLIKLKRFVSKYRIDTVVCVNEYTFLYGFLLKNVLRERFKLLTVIHHTILLPRIWIHIKNCFYRRLMNMADKVIFVCNNQLEYWVKKYKINPSISTYVYNGIDIDKFSDRFTEKDKDSLRHSLGLTCSDFVAGICAVLRPEKKHVDFVDAVALCREKGKPVKGVIIGDGPERSRLENYIKDQGINEHIRIIGFQDDVRPYLSICDCLVLASYTETFSMSALEAMSMGKPLVMTDIGGASEQIRHNENGFLFEKGDTESLARYLGRLSDNQKITGEFGRNSRALIIKKFSRIKMVEGYEKLITRQRG